MIRPPPRSTRTYTLFPYTTLFRSMLDTLDAVDRPNIGFQADMSHTFLYLLGYNAPQDRILPEDFKWEDREALTAGLKKLRSEEHTSELQSLMRISYAVFCLKKKKYTAPNK